jgi:hypothetical protein
MLPEQSIDIPPPSHPFYLYVAASDLAGRDGVLADALLSNPTLGRYLVDDSLVGSQQRCVLLGFECKCRQRIAKANVQRTSTNGVSFVCFQVI